MGNKRRDDTSVIPPFVVAAAAAIAGSSLPLHLLAVEDVDLALFGVSYLAAAEVVD
jgi:hypothetical protein